MFFKITFVNLAPFLDPPQSITFHKLVSRCFKVSLLCCLTKRSFRIDLFGLLQELPLIFLSRFHILSSFSWFLVQNIKVQPCEGFCGAPTPLKSNLRKAYRRAFAPETS